MQGVCSLGSYRSTVPVVDESTMGDSDTTQYRYQRVRWCRLLAVGSACVILVRSLSYWAHRQRTTRAVYSAHPCRLLTLRRHWQKQAAVVLHLRSGEQGVSGEQEEQDAA